MIKVCRDFIAGARFKKKNNYTGELFIIKYNILKHKHQFR